MRSSDRMKIEQVMQAGERSPLENETAGRLSLFGFMLYLLLSPQFLDTIGFHYSADTGAVYEKLHPGTYFIYLAFFVLLKRRTLDILYDIYKHHTACLALLIFYILLFAYMVFRDGIAGLAYIMDGHITVPICAILVQYIPQNISRRSLSILCIFAFVNSLIGLAEGAGKFRLLPFHEGTVFLNEEYFRASAFIGHPLANAAFTGVIMFVVLAIDLKPVFKYGIVATMLASLVAFGGRSSLGFSCIFMLIYGAISLRQSLANSALSRKETLALIASVPITLIAGAAALLLLVNSSIGERIFAYSSLDDESSSTRLLAFSVVGFMNDQEKLTGVSTSRVLQITDMANQSMKLSYIENPWILMFMQLGAVWFAIWIAITGWFAISILQNTPLALKFAILNYYVIASSYNSFGVKGFMYAMVVAYAVCTAKKMAALQAVHPAASNQLRAS